jgi:5-methylcytosine-specific restriction endonuclease McrA
MESAPCPVCGEESPFRLRPDTQHHGEIRCVKDGHRWIPKPSELKTPRRKVNPELFKIVPAHMRDHCWTCLRDRTLLKSLQPMVPLEAHHIIEVENGGADERDNIQIVCKECHSGIHRTREAFNRYGIYTAPNQ